VHHSFFQLAARRARAGHRAAAALASLAALGISGSARAHDYFFERAGAELVLEQGHEASAHAGDETVPYDAAIVQDARCIDADGRAVTLPKPTASPARFAGGCAVLFVATSSGYWSETAAGTVNKPKTEAAGAFYSWSSEESIKLVERWVPAAAAPLAAGLELTTASDPLPLERGDKITVLVTWHGEPRAGVTVAYDGEPRGVTDAAGSINIRLRHGGRQLISAGFDEPIESDRADSAVHATVLQFQIRE
jgi:nickel transport protein